MTAQFTTEMIDAGERLVRELDRRKKSAQAAFWLYVAEADDWHLIIATPVVRSTGSRRVYKSLQQVIAKTQAPIKLRSVKVLDSKDSLITGLSSAVKTGPGIAGIRLSRNAVRGHFIEDAYIYRLAV